MNLFKNIISELSSYFSKPKSWINFEYFDIAWEDRVRQMAKFIPADLSVLDLGCGKMHLRKYLHKNPYYPVDYKNRGTGTIICNFAHYEFPTQVYDVSFVSGCLEYIPNYKWFIKNICSAKTIVIISYCTTDEFGVRSERIRNGWVNHLSKKRLISLFKNNGFHLNEETLTPQRNNIFVFKKFVL